VADSHFRVVGIGACAGGVEALEAFFEAMPPDPGMAISFELGGEAKLAREKTGLRCTITLPAGTEVLSGLDIWNGR
jgi:hypothetical protein